MSYTVEYISDALKDLKSLDGSVSPIILNGIEKVRQNPLSFYEGGYGKPLGHKGGIDLSGLMKIKFRKEGIRVIYKVIKTDEIMKIIIISARADDQVYIEAEKRRKKYDL